MKRSRDSGALIPFTKTTLTVDSQRMDHYVDFQWIKSLYIKISAANEKKELLVISPFLRAELQRPTLQSSISSTHMLKGYQLRTMPNYALHVITFLRTIAHRMEVRQFQMKEPF